MILRDLTLHDFAVRFADEIQEWKRIRDQWQAKLIEAFHAVENGAADPFASDDPHWPVPTFAATLLSIASAVPTLFTLKRVRYGTSTRIVM